MKTCEEWSRAFDLEWNNITSNQAPGMTEYEKSVFLTDAQDVIEIGLYNGSYRNSFEETEEATVYLASLVSQADCEEVTSGVHRIVSNSQVFELPSDFLFRTLEVCKVMPDSCGEKDVIVVPVTQDEYWRTYRDPFKAPNGRKVLRLAYSESMEEEGILVHKDYSEIISKYPVSKYTVRYLRKPSPIILTDLTEDGYTIRGEQAPKTCLMHESLHTAILMEAVRLAKAVWQS